MRFRTLVVTAITGLVLAVPSVSVAQQPTIAELQAIIAQLQAIIAQLIAQQPAPLPGATFEVAPYGDADNAYTFVATLDAGQWTDYTYEIDWGEGDDSIETRRSRVITVCNSPHTCSAPGGRVHEYGSSGLFDIGLYAIKTTAFGTSRSLVASAQARAYVEDEAAASEALAEVHRYFGELRIAAARADHLTDEQEEEVEEIIDTVGDLLEEADDALLDEDYGAVIDAVVKATDLIDEALAIINEDWVGDVEIIDVDLDTVDGNSGSVPATIQVVAEVEAEAGQCPVNFPESELSWGDGTTSAPTTAQVTTLSSETSNTCRQKLTSAYTHTYTRAGTYVIEYFLLGVSGHDTVVVTIGTDRVTGSVNSKTYTTPSPIITGTATGTSKVTVVMTGVGDKYAYEESVTKESWSHQVRTTLKPGTYGVELYVSAERIAKGTITITVSDVPLSCSVTADSMRIMSGDSVTLTWTSTGASYGIGPSGDKIDAKGSATYSPEGTTTYTFTFVGPSDKRTSCSQTVFVRPRILSCQEPSTGTWRAYDCALPASAYSAISGQLKEISRLIGELF